MRNPATIKIPGLKKLNNHSKINDISENALSAKSLTDKTPTISKASVSRGKNMYMSNANKKNENFSIQPVWDEVIADKKMVGEVAPNIFYHVTDLPIYEKRKQLDIIR